MAEKVIRDGKVAVLVSYGYGAGWYSWNTECPALLFDPELVAAVEKEDAKALLRRAKQLCPDGYFGGADGLAIEWLPDGAQFRIDEYDGAEGIRLSDDEKWITA